MSYQDFKNSVLGTVVGDGQCVSLVVNNSRAYSEYLFPGVSWPTIFAPVSGARQLFGDANAQYYQAIANDHNNPNQVPEQGDVMVFDATPQAGYTNSFNNPYGHTGICESADSSGYFLLQQNSPTEGAAVNVTHYPWNYRPCIGWLRPVVQAPPSPAPPQPPISQPTPVAPTSASGQGSEQSANTPTTLPNLTNNIPSPPAPVDKLKQTKPNMPIVQDKASTLSKNTSQNSTSHISLSTSWWSRLIAWLRRTL